MDRERLAWVVGTLLCVALATRLVGRVPVDPQDREFANLIAQVGHEVRTRYVTEIDDEKLKQMQYAAMRGMLSVLDEHTVYVPPVMKQEFEQQLNGNFPGIGVTIRPNDRGEVAVVSPIEGGPAFEAGIEAGDVFTHVEGRPTVGLKPDEVTSRIKGPEGTRVNVTVRRYDGTFKDFTIERRQVVLPTVMGYQRNSDGSWDHFVDREAGIAYICIAQFNEETSARVGDALRKINEQGGRGVIVDVRFNGGGRLEEAQRIADFFLDEGVIVRVKGRNRPESTLSAKPGDTLFTGPVAMLVNDDSASASEILAGALADHRRAVVVGTRSYGKGSVQEVEDWGDEGLLKITVAQYFLPSGRSVQRMPDAKQWGVEPTVEVKLDDNEMRALIESWSSPGVIPPRSRATTRPARVKDRQLEAAVKALGAMLIRGE